MKLSLLVLTSGKQQGKALDIKTPQFLIGRDATCQLRPASPLISKRHCAILQRDGKAFIRDFGSTNGTFVNDEPLEGERELLHNDHLKIGPIEFAVHMETTPLRATTPAPATRPAAAAGIVPPSSPAPSKSDTPPPTLASKGSGEEDDIAAMLLELEDGSSSSSGSSGGEGVPEGSTVFDMKVPTPEQLAAGAKPGDDKKQPPKPASTGDTRSAAARILEKMTKRPRT